MTGLVMTKLDGTARGGILVAISAKFGLPVHAIGVGEGVEDLARLRSRGICARYRSELRRASREGQGFKQPPRKSERGSRNHELAAPAFSVQRRANRQYPGRNRAAGRDVPVNGIYGIAAGTWALIGLHDTFADRHFAGSWPTADHAVHRRRRERHVRRADAHHWQRHVGADQGHPVQRAGGGAALVGAQDRTTTSSVSYSARRSTTPRRAGTSSRATWRSSSSPRQSSTRPCGWASPTRTSSRSTASSPASTSGSSSRSSSSCRYGAVLLVAGAAAAALSPAGAGTRRSPGCRRRPTGAIGS